MAESKAPDVKKLADAGLTVRQIARTLDISTQAVYKHLAALGIDPPSKRDEEEGAA